MSEQHAHLADQFLQREASCTQTILHSWAMKSSNLCGSSDNLDPFPFTLPKQHSPWSNWKAVHPFYGAVLRWESCRRILSHGKRASETAHLRTHSILSITAFPKTLLSHTIALAIYRKYSNFNSLGDLFPFKRLLSQKESNSSWCPLGPLSLH